MILGILIIAIGVVLFLRNIGIIVLPASFWSLLYPVIIIVIGAYVIMGVAQGKKYWEWGKKKILKESGEEKKQ